LHFNAFSEIIIFALILYICIFEFYLKARLFIVKINIYYNLKFLIRKLVAIMENLPVLRLEGELYTDYSGFKRLFEFYHNASEHFNTTLFLDLYDLIWIDANLCALLQSMLHKLNHDNNLKFSTDLNYISQKFNVLFRNGFINNGEGNSDDRNSVIVLKSFSSKDKDGFIKYIEQELLSHRGIPKLTNQVKDDILNSLIELFNNIDLHSQTVHPFFVCGQYYPKQAALVFSMVDLGVGFLPAIHTKTNGLVTNSLQSIHWALEKGKTTKIGSPGGLGLFDLHAYCKRNKGTLQIITGDTYWSTELESTIFKSRVFSKPYTGSIINLFFCCN